MKISKRGQSAIEFAFAIIVLLGLFTVFFSFAAQNFAEQQEYNERAQLSVSAEKLYAEVKLLSINVDGYSRELDFDNLIPSYYNYSLLNGTGIRIWDRHGRDYIRFFEEEEFIQDSHCDGVNELFYSADYGLHVCCGSCDIDYGNFECSINTSKHWGSCEDQGIVGLDTQIRIACPLDTTSALFDLNYVLGGVVRSDSNYGLKSIKNVTYGWFESDNTFSFTNITYAFTSYCTTPSGVISHTNTTDFRFA